MAQFRVELIWPGKPAVILGGGRSLTAAQFHHVALARLDDRCRVIAVNDAVYPGWWADWLHAADGNWWRSHIQRVQHFRGIKTTIDPLVPVAWVTGVLNPTGVTGFDQDPMCCRTGNGSGYQAVHSAIHAGSRRIILLGFDMQGEHWHGERAGEVATDFGKTMAPHFESLIPALEAMKVEVINCSPDSVLRTFPRADLAAVL